MSKENMNSPGSPKNLTAKERRIEVLDLRRQHFSLRDIARALSVSHQTVKNDLDKSLRELSQLEIHKTEDYRMLELQRLERISHHVLMKAIQADETGKVTNVNLQAIEEYRKLSESKRKLLGLDSPTAVDLNAAWKNNFGTEVPRVEVHFIDSGKPDGKHV